MKITLWDLKITLWDQKSHSGDQKSHSGIRSPPKNHTLGSDPPKKKKFREDFGGREDQEKRFRITVYSTKIWRITEKDENITEFLDSL